MTIKEFSGNMKKAVEVLLGDGYEIKESKVDKNNGVVLHALVIKREDMALSPTMYLEPYFDDYRAGESIPDCASKLVGNYHNAIPEDNLDMSFYGDYKKVKKGLGVKLISSKLNASLLKDIPHVPFLDLEIVFYYRLETGSMADGTILIRNSHMEMWGITCEKIMKDSLTNAKKSTPGICKDLASVLSAHCPPGFTPQEDEDMNTGLYLVSNEKMIFGASVILYPGMMESVAEKLDSNLLIIPSSIHEVLVLSDKLTTDWDYLRDMIHSVNKTEMVPQDILSDSLYYFDRETGKITIAS